MKSQVTALLILTIPTLFASSELHGAGAVQGWVRRYNGPGNGGDYPGAIAVDSSGNAYVTGNSANSTGSWAIATIAYSEAGTPLWTNRFDSNRTYPGSPGAIAVDPGRASICVVGQANDSNGDYYVTLAYSGSGAPLWTNRFHAGSAWYPLLAIGASGNVYFAGSVGGSKSPDYATVAYSPGGAQLWTNGYGSPGFRMDVVNAIVTDAHDNVYVTGASDNPLTGPDFLTIAYSISGAPIWTNRYDGPFSGIDEALAAAMDNERDALYIAGRSWGFDGGTDYATIAYSTNGTALWTNRYGGSGHNTDNALALAVGKDGNVYVTGESYSANGYFDFATIAYSQTGLPLWTNWYSTAAGSSSAKSITIDTAGHVIVAGWSVSSGISRDFAVVAYSQTGLPLWTNRYDGPVHGNDQIANPFCVAAGPQGTIYVTGESEGLNDGVTSIDYATVKYVPVPEIRFEAIHSLPDATYRLTIAAPTNTAYRLEASTNLVTWLSLTNFPQLPVSPIQYTDTLASSISRRFYRAVWNP